MPPEPRPSSRNRAAPTPKPRTRASTPRVTPASIPAEGQAGAGGKRKRYAELIDHAAAHEKASRWIESALAAGEALRLANAAGDYEAVADAARRAMDARKRIRQAALKIKTVNVSGSLSDLGVKISEAGVARCDGLKNGCYLLEPPGCVGIDGRTLRSLCEGAGKQALVIVREPATRAGHWPVVAIGPVTVRAKLPPPAKSPTPDWCNQALDALEAAALESIDGDTARERLASLVEHAEATPECEGIYQAIIKLSAEAAAEAAATPARRGSKKPALLEDVRAKHDDDDED